MKNLNPDNWPAGAPEYFSPDGYEYQKRAARSGLIAELNTIPWLLNAAEIANRAGKGGREELLLNVASRLAEIVEHPRKLDIARIFFNVKLVNIIESGRQVYERGKTKTVLLAQRYGGGKPDLSKDIYNN